MEVIIFSAVAGILGMGAGGLISALLLKRPSENITCWMLSFASGIMTSIVCFSLMPEAIHLSGVGVSISGLILGIVVIMMLNRAYDKITGSNGNLKIHSTHEELYHGRHLLSAPAMIRSGMIMLIAIAMHNIPEGVAIGAGGSYDFQLGALLALMISLHNIPEGMAVAAPLLAGGINRWKVVFWTSASGATTLIGGIIGAVIGATSDFAVAISLSAAGGAMLYVVFGEIIPQSVVMTKNRTAPLITLCGVIVGLIITQI
ncbi:MAG: ZIP family metal transporter [Oscillospiraceae bacterium]|nr:ZIP family metal transporter [Oscillospiraceae bacterium]